MTRRGTPALRPLHQALCASCVDRPADRYEELDGAEYPYCSVCATHEVPDPDGRVSPRTYVPGSYNAARVSARRQRLKAQGICGNGANHGKATHGALCERCWLRGKRRGK